MRVYILQFFLLFLLGCGDEDNKSARSNCSGLYIDKRSRASEDFVRFRENVESAGFFFPTRDTSLYPFIKRLFFPPSSIYLRDTLKIKDCSIFDSLNIHYFELLSKTPSVAADYPEIRLEEEQFKDQVSCETYHKALASILKERKLISKPTILLQSGKKLYIFQAIDPKQTDELMKLSKLLDLKLDDMENNF